MDLTSDLGSLVDVHDRPAVRFERMYAHSLDRLWRTITDLGELAHWFPAPQVSIEPWLGGTIAFGGDPYTDDAAGAVIAWEPPTCLSFSWGPDVLHFHLEALDATTCRLFLPDVLEGRDAAARNAGGWLGCLGELAKALAGNPGQGPHGDAVGAPRRQADEAHVAAGLPYDDQIPEREGRAPPTAPGCGAGAEGPTVPVRCTGDLTGTVCAAPAGLSGGACTLWATKVLVPESLHFSPLITDPVTTERMRRCRCGGCHGVQVSGVLCFSAARRHHGAARPRCVGNTARGDASAVSGEAGIR